MLDTRSSGAADGLLAAPGTTAGLTPLLVAIDYAVNSSRRTLGRPDPAGVAHALAPFLSDSDLLRGVMCPCDPARYTRHLLGEGDGYCVLAIVWRPGQMSPVHAHKAWCALGVHRGWLVESFFDEAAGTARPVDCRPRGIGAVSYAEPGGEAIHRIANVGVVDALSIHVYGASYDRLGADVNRVLAD
jgi:predicted metal-dependent enzyme (double-stranded beta helix superfamily)